MVPSEIIRETVYKNLKDAEILKVRYSRFNRTTFASHFHREFSIGVILDGNATVTIGSKEYIAGSGDLVIINPDEIHSCNPVPDSTWSYYMYYINSAWVFNAIKEISGQRYNTLTLQSGIKVSKKLFSLFEMTYKLLDQKKESEIEVILYTIVEEILALEPELAYLESIDSAAASYLRKSIACIEKRYRESITVEELAEKNEISPYYLIRIFKKQFGLTPHAYLLRYRTEKCRQLIDRGYNYLDAAMECGFSDQSHMIRNFKKFTGCTPQSYLHSHSR